MIVVHVPVCLTLFFFFLFPPLPRLLNLYLLFAFGSAGNIRLSVMRDERRNGGRIPAPVPRVRRGGRGGDLPPNSRDPVTDDHLGAGADAGTGGNPAAGRNSFSVWPAGTAGYPDPARGRSDSIPVGHRAHPHHLPFAHGG